MLKKLIILKFNTYYGFQPGIINGKNEK